MAARRYRETAREKVVNSVMRSLIVFFCVVNFDRQRDVKVPIAGVLFLEWNADCLSLSTTRTPGVKSSETSRLRFCSRQCNYQTSLMNMNEYSSGSAATPILTTESSHLDFSHGICGLLSPGKANCSRVALPNPPGPCLVFWCFHNTPNSDMEYRIFNVRTGFDVCDCTRGCIDTVRESALKVDSGRKIPCRTGESNLRQRRAGPTLYQLSYIPGQKLTGVYYICSINHPNYKTGCSIRVCLQTM